MEKKPKGKQKKLGEIPPSKKRTDEILPSRKRNNDIIRGIKLMDIIDNINDKKIGLYGNWLEEFEPNLKNYLKRISTKQDKPDIDIHCRDLNYILDTLLERISKLVTIHRIKWEHYIEKPSLRLLNVEFQNLKCHRNMYNSNNNYMHIKKHMYDLCEDIQYIIEKKKELPKKKYCKDVISRVLKRWKQLQNAYHKDTNNSIFNLDNKCTIHYIMTKFSGNECEKVDEPPKAMESTSSILNQEQDPGTALATASGTEEGQVADTEVDPEQEDDVDLSDAVVTDFGMDISLQLPPVEEPKLDTTYAAASLCGVSLIGAMIYKFKPFGFGSRAPGMRNGMGGYPLPDAANGDYFMDNFEYLQTSIPNNEYHLGYGPAADH